MAVVYCVGQRHWFWMLAPAHFHYTLLSAYVLFKAYHCYYLYFRAD
jgi:hypothetical protein